MNNKAEWFAVALIATIVCWAVLGVPLICVYAKYVDGREVKTALAKPAQGPRTVVSRQLESSWGVGPKGVNVTCYLDAPTGNQIFIIDINGGNIEKSSVYVQILPPSTLEK